MTATLDKHHRLTLPKELREKAGFKPGASLELTFSEYGVIILPATAPDSSENETFREVMERCWAMGEPDPTFVAPPDMPWDADTPRTPIL